MKVLVAGGAGFLGNILCRKLLLKGYEVVVLDSLMYGNNLPNNLPVDVNLDVNKGYIGNFKQLENAAEGCDAIINLAAIVGPEACDIDKDMAVLTNETALNNFVRLRPKRLIHTSTCSIYGFYEDKILTEDDAHLTRPVSLYGWSKLNSESIVREGVDNHVIFRPGTLFGFSPRMRYDLVVNLFIAKALNGEPLTVNGGSQRRPTICLGDAADAYIMALEKDFIGTYNLTFKNYSILEIAKIINSEFHTGIIIDPNKTDVRSTLISNDKIKSLGINPSQDILDVVEDIRKSDTWKTYKNPIYSNLEMIKMIWRGLK